MLQQFKANEWDISDLLGSGGFGQVRLARNKITNKKIAIKMIDLKNETKDLAKGQKESFIHQQLNHPNIVKFYGSMRVGKFFNIFMEVAYGGELFHKIVMGVGVGYADGKWFILQILDGINYIHSLGITHRDIKLRNLLLDGSGNIKIADFGIATVFRKNGAERTLTTLCGSFPYTAPEVHTREYKAQPADIWSCGIVLARLLTGEKLWEVALIEDDTYRTWINKTDGHPLDKVNNSAKDLLKNILEPNPDLRYTMPQIMNHSWLKIKDNAVMSGGGPDHAPATKRLKVD